jgi:hypothetical protein
MIDLRPFFWFLLSLDLPLSSEEVFDLGAEGSSCLVVDLTLYYYTSLHFTFCILPFIGDLLVLLHCIDIIVLNNPFDLLLWSLVRH